MAGNASFGRLSTEVGVRAFISHSGMEPGAQQGMQAGAQQAMEAGAHRRLVSGRKRETRHRVGE
ncbi:MAG TPA: hypothetical protein VFI97_06970, partial [Arthrobacter sp.]|nr:hypothetical protein [Arthrobacter sp.]